LGVLRWVPESHPLHARLTGGPAASLRTIGSVAAQRAVLTPVLALAFGGAAVFAYIAGTTFVFQDIYRHGGHGHMPHSGHSCRRRDQAN
jgi:DHA1 family bicyclomycin/chloramphenicol resistance-like MFS transporter